MTLPPPTVLHELRQAPTLIGQSPALEALRPTIRRLADTDLPILIVGEPGTGKQLLAQLIHCLSRRRDRPLATMHCAASSGQTQDDLFATDQNGSPDAPAAPPGRLKLACGGSILLLEVGRLSTQNQARLVRLLAEQDGPPTASGPAPADLRVLATSSENLGELVRQGQFREDLHPRLSTVTLVLPPLRERPGDILLLLDHFLDVFCQRAQRKTPQVSAAARKRLAEHAWPGNVRQLRNLAERLAYWSAGDPVESEEIAGLLAPPSRPQTPVALDFSLADATAGFQREHIRQAIETSGGNMSKAAARLGLHRSNLYRKMRQLGMPAPDSAPADEP